LATCLQFRLESGPHLLPLGRVHRVAAFAALTGQPEEYFAGWLRFSGSLVPVFDLNRVVCEASTPEEIGSRIMLVEAPPGAPVPYIGLLAPAVTETVTANHPGTSLFDLDLYLQMLANFIPAVPENAS
jgi:chemotaxis signal transduction protein